MKKAFTYFSTTYLLLFSIAAISQPINDDAASAIILPVNGGCTVLYSNIGATRAINEPLASCSDDPANPIYANEPVVWFKFVAPTSGAVRISTDNGLGTLTDAQAALYSVGDSSDYNTFQIISCDDDNGSNNGVAAVLYATGLTGGIYYYVSVDGWPTTSGTFCVAVDELNTSMISTSNNCGSNFPAAWGGSSAWPINPGYQGWVPLVDGQSNLVALVRNALGGYANAFTSAQNVHAGAVRQMPNNTYYLDRNFMIRNTDFASNINIQLFFLDSEFNSLNLAAGGNLSLNNLHVVKQDIVCQNDFNPAVPGIALPQFCYNQSVGSVNGVSWIMATTPSFPAPGYSNFYIIPGPGVDTITSLANLNPPCFADSLILQATDTTGWNYTWSNSTAGLNNTVYSSGIYHVSYTDSSCKVRLDSFNVQFSSFSDLASWNYGTIKSCQYGENGSAWIVPPTSDTTTYTYTWTDSSAQVLQINSGSSGDSLLNLPPGVYTVSIHTIDNCDTNISLTISYDLIEVSFETDTITCKGNQLTFNNTSTSNLTSWMWEFGDGQTSNQASPVHSYSSPGTYYVILVGATPVPCLDTAYATVHVIDTVPLVSFTMSRDSICEGTSVDFIPTYIGGTSALTWDFGDGVTTGVWQPKHSFDTSGILTVKVTAHHAYCPDTSYYRSVTIFSYPKVDLGPDTSICLNGEAIFLTNYAETGVTEYKYSWITGDSAKTIQARHHGRYSVTVTAGKECSTTDSVMIYKGCYINIPNAFSPNNDGVNDYFFPRQSLSNRLTRFRMKVFNRWGQLIFETQSVDGRGWDGRFNGKDQPQGVYVYLIEAEIDGRHQEKYEGNLTLIR